jgi:class 3 adenylate cyclase/FixJ family two-component response regulator
MLKHGNAHHQKSIIICVDDERIILNALDRQLQRKFGDHYEYEFAESAEEALVIIEELTKKGYTIATVISDQIMPGMSGEELLTYIHKKHPKSLKVLLSGQASLESVINVINNADVYRYLTKPWDEDALLEALEDGLQELHLAEITQKQNELFKRFLPQRFLECLTSSIIDIKLGDYIERDMSILFADIQNFAAITAKMTLQENYNFINNYLSYIDPVIQENEGFIYKYTGNALLALFPTPQNALKAALGMQQAIKKFNQDYPATPLCPLSSEIGLHTSALRLGVVGVPERMQGAIISDTVNVAAHLQKIASFYKLPIIASQEFLQGLNDKTLTNNCRDLGRMNVEIKSREMSIHEVVEPTVDPRGKEKILTKHELSEGLRNFSEKEFTKACLHFKKVLKQNPHDEVAKFYLERATNYIAHDVPQDWSGVESIKKKVDG